ncbi:hypothetical protein Lv-1_gp45 [Lactobacillus phage Lv-1]|uniref:hypothetical protein n=1 Tax=Lactobacillus phage Lv-1 TaxID=578234 RepID=UPI000189A53E|nr:hypothetical protein Lv-1_gp45 [Lactobacillus phage Lv-1]ACJ68946.1 hypothetical protein [Lactobacillus phage Lv-1]
MTRLTAQQMHILKASKLRNNQSTKQQNWTCLTFSQNTKNKKTEKDRKKTGSQAEGYKLILVV